MQPEMRKDYCAQMGGGDTADQQNGSNRHGHKSCNNYWRGAIEQKVEQAMTTIFLCFRKWVPQLKSEAQSRIEGETGDTVENTVRKEELGSAIRELGRLAKLERAEWDRILARELMARCNVGSLNQSGKRKAPERNEDGRVWGIVRVKEARDCMNPD